MTKWISVKDSLPEPELVVLIYTKEKTIELACINPPQFRGTFWFYPGNKGWNEDDISYWMPLREPPGRPNEN